MYKEEADAKFEEVDTDIKKGFSFLINPNNLRDFVKSIKAKSWWSEWSYKNFSIDCDQSYEKSYGFINDINYALIMKDNGIWLIY